MKRTALLALAAGALLLPGCYAAKKGFPLDASGMEYPLRHTREQFDDQCERTAESIAHLPRTLNRHFRECWRNITEDPTGW